MSSPACRNRAASSRCASTCPAGPSPRSRGNHAPRSDRLSAPRGHGGTGRGQHRRVVRDDHRRHAGGHGVRRRVPRAPRPQYASRLRPHRRAHACVHHGAAGARCLDIHERRRDAGARRRAAAHAHAVEGRAAFPVDHRRAFPRLLAAADVRPGATRRPVDRRVRAGIRRARVRARREIRTARQARPAHPLAGGGCARRQHRARLQEHPVCVEHGHRQRRLGPARAHTRHGDARRRQSGLVAPELRRGGRRRGARSFLVRGGSAGRDHRRVHDDHRQARRRSRAGGSACGFPARTTRRQRMRSRSRGSCGSGAFRATC